MRINSIIIIAALILLFSGDVAQSQNYVMFGNPDGSPVYVHFNSDIEIGLWVAIEYYIGFIFVPLASNDDIIVSRNGADFFYPLIEWDDASVMSPSPDSPIPGYTNQPIIGIYDLGGGPNPPLFTDGDTMLIADYLMHTFDDTTYLYQMVCPFMGGLGPPYGGIIFGDIYGNPCPVDVITFSCLIFVDYYPGDANNSGVVNGLDVVYLVNYFRGNGTPPVPILGGDANGDCLVNGLDVIYLVAYFKGGPEPFYGDCY